jgi:polysaccharide export outer membrane protein
VSALILLLVALAAAEPAVEVDAPASTAAGESDYRIGVEDVLRVVVWGEPELSIVGLRVRPDGKITVPLAGDIHVVGRKPQVVGQTIGQKLAQFIKEPNVTVIVEEINSFRVYFLGEVNVQGAISFAKPTRLLQGIAAAGGLTQFAKNEVILLRQEGAAEKRVTINYKLLLAGDPRQDNMYLEPGDTLIFP